MQQVDSVITKLGLDGCDNIEPLRALCKKIHCPRPAYLVLAVSVVAIGMIVIGLAQSVLTNIIGMLYPAYKSIKAIQTQGAADDDKQWLTYWIVFSFTTVVDSTFGFVLAFIPFYYLVKLVFFICLFHPKVQGATVIYDKVILPLYNVYGAKIDSELERLNEKVQQKVDAIRQ